MGGWIAGCDSSDKRGHDYKDAKSAIRQIISLLMPWPDDPDKLSIARFDIAGPLTSRMALNDSRKNAWELLNMTRNPSEYIWWYLVGPGFGLANCHMAFKAGVSCNNPQVSSVKHYSFLCLRLSDHLSLPCQGNMTRSVRKYINSALESDGEETSGRSHSSQQGVTCRSPGPTGSRMSNSYQSAFGVRAFMLKDVIKFQDSLTVDGKGSSLTRADSRKYASKTIEKVCTHFTYTTQSYTHRQNNHTLHFPISPSLSIYLSLHIYLSIYLSTSISFSPFVLSSLVNLSLTSIRSPSPSL
jgi:hypothetical protein